MTDARPLPQTAPAERGPGPALVIIIPCYNEAQTVAGVVAAFARERPDATFLVVDNNSSDDTAARARAAGAMVMTVRKQGKGQAVRAVFRRVDADLYALVDGDGTYEPQSLHGLIDLVVSGAADMAVARRVAVDSRAAYRPLHVFGNRLVCRLIEALFGAPLNDIMSGYRVFHRDVVRRTPLVSRGFEIETELTVQALAQDFIIVERDSPYYARPEGSLSKLNTFFDGARVLWTILSLFMAYKPLTFFGGVGLVFLLAAVAFAGFSRMAAAGLMACGLGLVLLGVVLTNINNRFMAILSLMTRGRLSEGDSRRIRCDSDDAHDE